MLYQVHIGNLVSEDNFYRIIAKSGKWKHICVDGKFFPVKTLSKVFRAKYVSLLRKSAIFPQDEIDPLFTKAWVVYAKRPFAHPSHVVEYLGRYTHKASITTLS